MRDLTNVSSQGSGGMLGPCRFITPLPGFTTCRDHGPDDPRCILSSPDFMLIESPPQPPERDTTR
jgi:hypothetical protein